MFVPRFSFSFFSSIYSFLIRYPRPPSAVIGEGRCSTYMCIAETKKKKKERKETDIYIYKAPQRHGESVHQRSTLTCPICCVGAFTVRRLERLLRWSCAEWSMAILAVMWCRGPRITSHIKIQKQSEKQHKGARKVTLPTNPKNRQHLL